MVGNLGEGIEAVFGQDDLATRTWTRKISALRRIVLLSSITIATPCSCDKSDNSLPPRCFLTHFFNYSGLASYYGTRGCGKPKFMRHKTDGLW